MPLYFPRNAAEEHEAKSLLPEDTGNEEDGEPVIAERQIRITKAISISPGANGDPNTLYDEQNEEEGGAGKGIMSSEDFDASSLATMAPDHDTARLRTLAKEPKDPLAEARARYRRWLRRARQEDVSSIAALRCLYLGGLDREGRRIVVWVGKRFDARNVDLNKSLCHVINTLDSVVDREFVIVYFHAKTTSANQPSTSFLREAYRNLDNRYRKNMRQLYIVHSSLWTKIMVWFFATFTLSDIKKKIQHLKGLEFVYDHMSADQIEVPDFVSEHDRKEHGVGYHVPTE
eukprot:UC1_evm1s435